MYIDKNCLYEISMFFLGHFAVCVLVFGLILSSMDIFDADILHILLSSIVFVFCCWRMIFDNYTRNIFHPVLALQPNWLLKRQNNVHQPGC
jgi:hypothetical protein